MNLDSVLQQALAFVGTFNINLVIFLFLICAIGEFGVSIPYLLETIWLLSGYHAGSGVIPPWDILLLWLAAQAGRQTGGALLYYVSRFGSLPLMKLYQRYFAASLSPKLTDTSFLPIKMFRRMDFLSPFSIALGRLFWLRIPLTLTLGVKKRLTTLSLGIMLSSLVWDSIYILLGVIGGRAVLKPWEMVLYSLIGLTVLYIATFAIRRFARLRQSKAGAS